MRLLYAEHRGPYPDTGHVFERVTAHAFAYGLFPSHPKMIGVFFNDCTVVPPEKPALPPACQWVQRSRPPASSGSSGWRGGRCAVLHHVGPYGNLPRSYDWMLGTWMPQKGLEPADQPCFEDYLNNPKELPPAMWLTDICVPLA